MANPDTTTVLVILGMWHNGAREHVAESLVAVEGVRDVDVSLHRGTASIVHTPSCPLGDLVAAVVRAGFGAALVRTSEPAGAGNRTGPERSR